MSNARYLEIDSTYRDRTQWPLPGEFEVLISQSGRKGYQDAVDPYSNAAVNTKWIGLGFTNIINVSPDITMFVDLTAGIGQSGDDTILQVTAAPGELQVLKNYYQFAVAEDASADRRRIVDYRYMGNDRAEITLSSAFPTTLADNDPLIVSDPTDLSSIINPLFFVPSGDIGSNSYAGYYLFNETQNESRPISDYDFITHLLSVDTTGSQDSTSQTGPVTSWTLGDTYSIRRETPSACVTLTGTVNTNSSFNFPPANSFTNLRNSFIEKTDILTATQRQGSLVVGGATSVGLDILSVAVDGFYNGCTLRMMSGPASGLITTISGYTAAGFIATLDPSFPVALAPVATDNYTIECPVDTRRIIKYVDYRDNADGGSLLTIQFPSTSSNSNGFYNGLYVDAGASGIRLITRYDVVTDTTTNIVTRTATVSTAFAVAPIAGQAFTITSGIVYPPFAGSLVTNDICILPFTADNLSPFIYTGSLVSQQEMVCYEIELLKLILPNQTLSSGQGGGTAFYQYLYVELSNVSGASAGMKNVIYTNNPNASRMVFRAAIDDVQNPESSSFIKIDGDGMVQTLKFKPNDNLRFSVHLSNGDVFNTVIDELFAPNAPRPSTQISALFSIKRI